MRCRIDAGLGGGGKMTKGAGWIIGLRGGGRGGGVKSEVMFFWWGVGGEA